ncbi:MAG TPA: hypothetical protein VLN45_07175, partial [Ignavibacteriaceae bacterium]|nr:hypothetical protein [Ignavibacteriaceae bacterium]
MRRKILLLAAAIQLFTFINVSAQYENMSDEEIKKKASEMGYEITDDQINDYRKQPHEQNFTP